ncbi:MAG: hypothetical protein ABI877_07795, partial [Gemmatimonadaceae bacterium]
SDNVTASVTRSGGFTGDVAITVEGVPAGVTGTVSNINTSGGVSNGTVTVNVAASTVPGSYNIVVRASGSGVTSVTASATLIVTAIPAIGITLTTPLGVNQGASGQTIITITRTNFTGNVSFALEGAPAGVTGTFVPAPAPGATTTLTVQVDASVVIASYNMTVRATGTGVTAATAPLMLTVNPAPAISIALSASTVSVDQGASGQSTVTITRTNFTTNVTLALEGAPVGVTGTFVPSPAPGTTSVLTIQVGAAVPAATYNLTVRATGDGIPAATAPLDLTVTIPASYTMTATSPGIAVGGGAVPSTIAIVRTNFVGDVALTLDGAPAGVTGSFNPQSVTGTSSILTLTVSGSVVTGTYPMNVRGTATGLVDRTAAFALTVAPVTGSYTLSISPAGSVGVSQGGGVAVPVAINRTGGFTGNVTLSVTGAPNGMTATLAPTPTTGNVSALSILAAQSLSADPYPLTVTGTTPGLADQTTDITAIVTAPNVSLDFSNCGTMPNWFAIQDGVNGPWVQILAPGGTYKTRTTQSAVALTLVTPGFGTNHSIWTQYMSATELQNTTGTVVCAGNPILPSRTAVVSTVNLATFDIAWVSFGGALRTFSSPLPGGTLSGILPGMHDLVSHSAGQSGGFQASDRLIIRRDLNPSNGASILPALDFGPASTETFPPIAATISTTSLLPGEILNGAGTLYKTGASCINTPLWFTAPNAAVTSFIAYGVPVIKQRPTDFHAITLNTFIPGVQFRFVTEYMQALTNRTITLPSSLPDPAITTLPAGYQRLQFQFTAPTDLSSIITASYGFNSGNPVFLSATAAWFGSTAINLSVPAFANSANWDDSWGPPANPVATDWNLTGESSPLVGPCTVGGRLTSARRMGHF